MTLYPALKERWDPDAPALTFGGVSWTFAELDDRIRRAIGWCHARGLSPGDVVALRLPKDPLFLELHLGALAAGVTTLPMHPNATPSEVSALCKDASVRVFVDDPDRVRTELDAAEPGLPHDTSPNTIAVLLYTSGTTGRPKGVPLTHANLLAGVRSLHDAWRWSSDDVLLHALPLFHVHGLFVAQYGALYAGAHTRLLSAFDPDAVIDALPACTVFMGVPTFYSRLLQRGPGDADLSRMRLFTSGSAPLPAAHHTRFEDTFGHRILERYGMTEIGIVLANPYDGERRAGTVGHPLAHVRAKVVDSEGREVEAGTVGQICIAGASVFGGYLGRPDATATTLIDGWMQTGDLGSVSADGWFQVVGRAKDLVISGGMNVYPGEVEARITQLAGIREAAVFGVPDEDLGERVAVAVVVDGEDWTPDVWTDALRDQLAPYKLPRRWFRVDALPRNTMGKVGKAVLRERYGVTIRPATEADLAVLVAHNRAMCDETEDFSLDVDTVTAGVSRVLEGTVGATYWIAERAGEIAGQLMITTEWSDWRNAIVWWIQSVYVAPEHRRCGVYRALHDHITGCARREGAAGVRLYVERDNHRAQATYRSVGMTGDHYLVYETMFGGNG